MSALLLDDVLLKFVVTEVVLFSVVGFYDTDISQGSVATHVRFGGIFSDTTIKIFPESDSEKGLKIDEYLTKL